jgi:hypothetical protein
MLPGAFDRIALAFATTDAPRIFGRGDTPGGIALVNEGSASFSPERSMPYVNSTSHSLRHSALNRAAAALFVDDLDLFINYLAGEPINCHVDPVVLFPLHDEIVAKVLCIRLVATRLGYHIDEQVPCTRLGKRS